MLTNIFSILEHRPCKKNGGFIIPYTAVVENGSITEAYKIVKGEESNPDGFRKPSEDDGQETQIKDPSRPRSTSDEKDLSSALVGCIKKEYDLAFSTVQTNFDLEDEIVAFDVKRRMKQGRKQLPVQATFIGRLQREEYAFERGSEGGSNLLQVDYLNCQQVHNMISRGDPTKDPINSDTKTALQEIEEQKALGRHGGQPVFYQLSKAAKKKQKKEQEQEALRTESSSRAQEDDGLASKIAQKKSGLLQAAIEPAGPHNELIRVVFESNSPKGGSFPDHAKCTITSKRNVYEYKSTAQLGYERMCTFDGPKLLIEDTSHLLTDEVKQRVLHATKFILASIADALKRYAALAVFMFKIGKDGQLNFMFTPYIGLFNAGDNTTNRIDPMPKFKIPIQYESVLRRPKPSHACNYEEDLLEEPKLSEFGMSPERERYGVHGRSPGKSKEEEEDGSWLLSNELGQVSGSGQNLSRGNGASLKSPKKGLPQEQGQTIDYDKIMSAVENQFPAPLPAHAIEHIKANRRALAMGMGQDVVGSDSAAKLRKEKCSPFAHHPRENPQASQDALQRRQQCTAVNNVRTLLQALEGKHRISLHLADNFGLSKEERKFLQEGVYSSLKKQQETEGSRPVSQQSIISRRSITPSVAKKIKARVERDGKRRIQSDLSFYSQEESKPAFHIPVEPNSGYFNKSDMRNGPLVGRAKPLLKPNRKPIWDTRSGKKPVFAPKQTKKSHRHQEHLHMAQDLSEPSPREGTPSERESDFDEERLKTGRGPASQPTSRQRSVVGSPNTSHLQTPGAASVNSRNLDQIYPELAGFTLVPSGHGNKSTGAGGLSAQDQSSIYQAEDHETLGLDPRLLANTSAGANERLSGRAYLDQKVNNTLADVDAELKRLRAAGKSGFRVPGPTNQGQSTLELEESVSLSLSNDPPSKRSETIDVAVVDISHAESRRVGTGEGGKLSLGVKTNKPDPAITPEDKVEFLLEHPSYGGSLLVKKYRRYGRGGVNVSSTMSSAGAPSENAVQLLQGRIDTLAESTRRAVDYLYGLCYLLKSIAMASREEYRSNPAEFISKSAQEAAMTNEDGVVLFSIPPRELGHLEKKVVHFLAELPFFEQMNTEENIAELQLLLISTKHHSSTGGACRSLTDGLYCAHLDPDTNIVACPTFSVRFKPPKFELQSHVTNFVLETIRATFLEKLEEISEEYNLSDAYGATASPTHALGGAARSPSVLATPRIS